VTDDEEWHLMFLVTMAFTVYFAGPLFGFSG